MGGGGTGSLEDGGGELVSVAVAVDGAGAVVVAVVFVVEVDGGGVYVEVEVLVEPLEPLLAAPSDMHHPPLSDIQ